VATKRKKLTILEKVKIIHEVENNPNTPATEIAQKFSLPPSSLSCIMKRNNPLQMKKYKCGGEANKINCLFNIKYM
jgi:hypothetical protein